MACDCVLRSSAEGGMEAVELPVHIEGIDPCWLNIVKQIAIHGVLLFIVKYDCHLLFVNKDSLSMLRYIFHEMKQSK